ncbi:hypothetical protein D3C73_1494360 [compost metagenome]
MFKRLCKRNLLYIQLFQTGINIQFLVQNIVVGQFGLVFPFIGHIWTTADFHSIRKNWLVITNNIKRIDSDRFLRIILLACFLCKRIQSHAHQKRC